MNEFQKMVKLGATIFAIFLTVVIVSGIAKAAFAVVNVFTEPGDETASEILEYYEDIKSLDIDIPVGDLKMIEKGEDFQVQGRMIGTKFESEVSRKGTLKIKGKGISAGWLTRLINGTVEEGQTSIIMYTPEGAKFKKIKINNGVGDLTLEGVSFKELELDGGIGDTHLLLTGEISDYSFDIDFGIGSIYLDGEEIEEIKTKNKTAESTVEIDGGIGDVYINFME